MYLQNKAARADSAEVLRALSNILNSELCKNSPRTKELLNYVVNKTLLGEHSELNGYAIGVSVFDRKLDFDPGSDPIVRVQFSRLRRTLKEYYLTEGVNDPLRIELMPGNYVASFIEKPTLPKPTRSAFSWVDKFRPTAMISALIASTLVIGMFIEMLLSAGYRDNHGTAVSNSPFGPTLRILPLENTSLDADLDEFSMGFTAMLEHSLARHRELHIVRPNSGDIGFVDRMLYRKAVNYNIRGTSARNGDDIILVVELIDTVNQQVVWSQTYHREANDNNLFTVAANIAEDISIKLNPGSTPVRNLEKMRLGAMSSATNESYRCVLSYYDYIINRSKEENRHLVQCLSKTVEAYPNFAHAHSMLASLYLDNNDYDYQGLDDHLAHRKALTSARRAVNLDSEDFFTHQIMGEVYLAIGQINNAKRSLQRALMLYPNNADLLANNAWLLAYDEKWDIALRYALRAINLKQVPPYWYVAVPVMYHHLNGEHDLALEYIGLRTDVSAPYVFLLRSLIYNAKGQYENSDQQWNTLVSQHPEFAIDPQAQLKALRMPDSYIDFIGDEIAKRNQRLNRSLARNGEVAQLPQMHHQSKRIGLH